MSSREPTRWRIQSVSALRVIAPAAVGGLRDTRWHEETLVVPDQLADRTTSRFQSSWRASRCAYPSRIPTARASPMPSGGPTACAPAARWSSSRDRGAALFKSRSSIDRSSMWSLRCAAIGVLCGHRDPVLAEACLNTDAGTDGPNSDVPSRGLEQRHGRRRGHRDRQVVPSSDGRRQRPQTSD